MDVSYCPMSDYKKDLEIEVNTHLGLHPIYEVSRVLNLDEFQEEGYNCTVHVGHMHYQSNPKATQKSCHDEDLAEKLATRNAYIELSKRDWKIATRKQQNHNREKLIHSNVHKVPGVETTAQGFQSFVNMGKAQLDVVYNCGKYMSDEVFATQFKDLVKYIIKNVAPAHHKYSTRLHQDGPVTGYKSVLNLNTRKFESLGLMADEYQAEQSAAEVCLRTLRFLPDVEKKDYLIQPYQGGVPRSINIEKPYLFTTTVASNLLESFLDSRNMMKPRYYVKNAPISTLVFNVSGEIVPNLHCITYVGGKKFKAPVPDQQRVAIQLASNEALEYFGISHPRERMELRKYIRVNRYDFCQEARSLGSIGPSENKGWAWPRFCQPASYGDLGTESLLSSGILMENLRDPEYMNELVKSEMERKPSFKDRELTELTDLCVAEVDAKNPNIFVIGDSHFSFKVLIEDGKIYSKQRQSLVEVLPGHNIRKLRCEYRVSVPSLDIHLKAIDCHDLYYNNPPLPIVTSCGVVVLYHDSQASPEDIFVLVRRRNSGTTFESNIQVFEGFLQTLIAPKANIEVTPAECTEGIEKWLYKEVKLLSEMTMDSLCELISKCTTYDTRWNELLARGELLAPLKEIQDICLKELKRREDEGISDEELVWELPQSEFVTRFDTIGIHLEDSLLCGIRALTESTGVRVNLADMESSPSLDVPVGSGKQQRGDMSRYYIYKSTNTDRANQDKEVEKGYGWAHGPKPEHGMRRVTYEHRKPQTDIFQHRRLMVNIEFVNADGSRRPYVSTLKHKIQKVQENTKRRKSQGRVGEDKSTTNDTDVVAGDNSVNGVADAGVADAELLKIPLPGDPEFESYKASLSKYCKLKKLSEPIYTPNVDTSRKRRNQLYSGTVKVGSNVFHAPKLASFTKKADVLAAKEALNKIGYIYPATWTKEVSLTPEIRKGLHKIDAPGQPKFISYKHSLQVVCLKEGWSVPRYSFKREAKYRIRAAVICGKSVIYAKEVAANPHKACGRVAYEALQQFGYYKDVKYTDGFARPTVRGPGPGAGKNKDDHIDEDDMDEPSDTIEKENGNEEECTGESSNTIDSDNVAVKESENEDASIDEPNTEVEADKDDPAETSDKPVEKDGDVAMEEEIDPYSILSAETTTAVDNTVEADTDDAAKTSEEPVKNEGDVDMDETDPYAIIEEEATAVVDKNPETEQATNGEKRMVVSEWIRDDDVYSDTISRRARSTQMREEGDGGEKTNAVSEWIKDDDVQLDDIKVHFTYQEAEHDRRRLKRKKYREAKNRKMIKLQTNKKLNDKSNTSIKEVEPAKGPMKDDVKVKVEDKMPDISWRSLAQKRALQKSRPWKKATPFPARDAYREQCLWMRLDEAVEVCPILMKISQTSQFKEELKNIVEEANKILETEGSKNVTVKTSLLPDLKTEE